MSVAVCTRCAWIDDEAAGSEFCVLCGGQLESHEAGGHRGDDEGSISLLLEHTTFRCDEEECATRFLLTRSRQCPACGRLEREPDPLAQEREDAYGDGLRRLLDDTTSWREQPVSFADRGSRQDVDEYMDWVRSIAMQKPNDLLDEATTLLNETDWNETSAPATREAFRDLLEVCRSYGSIVDELAGRPPPLGLLSVHRQVTRAVAALGRAAVGFASLLDGDCYLEARAGMRQAQGDLDLAADRMRQVSTLLGRAERLLDTPGFWTVNDEYDTGRIAWEGVDQEIVTIDQAAAIVRRTFERVPGVADLPDEQAFMLMPAAAIGASLQDPERLTQRAIAARRLLDEADANADGWIADADVLVELVWRGHREVIDQVVRLGHDIRIGAPRRILMQTALDVFAKLYEGPLRRLGAIVAIAAHTASDRSLELDASTVERYLPRNTCKSLTNADPILLDGIILPALRNAEAHYDFQLTEDGVQVRVLPGTHPERTEWFSDDDFFEQLLNLDEALVAIELAVIPWLETRPEPSIQAELERRGQADRPAREAVRALAGLKGWTDIELCEDGDTLRIDGAFRGKSSDDPALGLLPVVAAAWTLFEDIRRIDLQPALDTALTLTRDQFPAADDTEYQRHHQVALLVAETLRARGNESPLDVEVRWQLIPALVLTTRATNDLLDNPHLQLATEVARYLAWAGKQLASTTWSNDLIARASTARQLLKKARRAIGAWRSAPPGSGLEATAQDDLRRIVQRLMQLAEDCRTNLGPDNETADSASTESASPQP